MGWDRGLWVGVLCVAAAAGDLAAVGCAASPKSSGDTHDTGPAGGQGGTTASGGQGGAPDSACAYDCSIIETDQCHVGICNEQSGQCQIVDAPPSTSCDDGLFCTVADQCDQGECVGGPLNDCGLTPEGCQLITCNESTQDCAVAPAPEGQPCTPADLCEINATCQNGICVGSPKDCTFAPVPNECYNSECNSNNGQCEPVPGNDGTSCVDDVDKCLINGSCSSGDCINTQPTNCSYLTQGCELGVCDSQTGNCGVQSVLDGDPCDDLNWCTTGETCQSGQCQNGVPVTSCQDSDNCCPANCTAGNDSDCACNVTMLEFSELNIGGVDYIILHNPTGCLLSLNGLEILFDDSSSTDRTTVLPNQDLGAGLSVTISESPQAGEIDAGGNIMFDPSRGGAALLCNGACDPNNGSNVIDVIAFDGGQVHGALPPPVTFSPAGVTGIDSGNQDTHSWLRTSTAGVAPNFLAADWSVGAASQ